MSTPAPPHSPISLHPVRQQLDELDGLLQRMLELPVEPADSADPSRPQSWEKEREGDVEASGNSALLESSGPEPGSSQSTSPLFSDFQFTLSDHGPETVAASLPASSPRLGQGWDGGRESAGQPQSSLPQADEWEERTSIWLWPLVALNRMADACLGRLGRPGRWWQGTWGRACLGLMGLLLLTGALLWGILDWMQWTW